VLKSLFSGRQGGTIAHGLWDMDGHRLPRQDAVIVVGEGMFVSAGSWRLRRGAP